MMCLITCGCRCFIKVFINIKFEKYLQVGAIYTVMIDILLQTTYLLLK